jgi:hypothetical protein
MAAKTKTLQSCGTRYSARSNLTRHRCSFPDIIPVLERFSRFLPLSKAHQRTAGILPLFVGCRRLLRYATRVRRAPAVQAEHRSRGSTSVKFRNQPAARIGSDVHCLTILSLEQNMLLRVNSLAPIHRQSQHSVNTQCARQVIQVDSPCCHRENLPRVDS